MRILKWCLIVAAMMLVIVVVGVIFLANVDFNAAKPRVVAWLDAATGRQWAIGGDLQVRLGPETQISAGDVRIRNPDWASARNFLRVGELNLVIDLRSLLRGPVLIQQLSVHDAEIALESDASGNHTWSFGASREPASDDDDEALALVIRDADVADLRLVYSAPGIRKPLEIDIAAAKQHQRGDRSLVLDAVGTFDDKPLRIEGGCKDFNALLSGRDLDCAVSGKLGDLAFSSRANIDSLRDPREPRFELELKSPDAKRFTELLGLPEVAHGDLNIAASLTPGASGLTARLKGNLADVTVDAGAVSAASRPLEKFALDVDARGPHFGRLLQAAGMVSGLPDERFELSVHLRRSEKRLEVKEASLILETAEASARGEMPEFPGLRGAKIGVSAKGSDIAAFRALTGAQEGLRGPFGLDARLDGVSDAAAPRIEINLETEPATVRVSGPLGDPPDFIGSELAIAARGADLRRVGAAWGEERLPAGAFEFGGDVKIAGRDFLSKLKLELKLAENRLRVEGDAGIDPHHPETDLRVAGSGKDGSILFAAAGIDGVPLTGPLELSVRLRAAGDRYRLDQGRISIGRNAFGVEGLLAEPPSLDGTALRVSATGPSARELGRLAGITEGIVDQPFDGSGRLEIGADGYALEDVELKIGDGRIALDGLIGRTPEYLNSRVKISGAGPRLEELLADNRHFDVRPGPYSFSLVAGFAKHKLVVEKLLVDAAGAKITGHLDAEMGDETRGAFTLEASGPDIGAWVPESLAWHPGALPFDVATQGSWRGETLEIRDSHMRIAEASLKLAGRLDPATDASLRIDFETGDLSRLGRLGSDPLPEAPFRMSAVVQGQIHDFRLDGIEARFADTEVSGSAAIDLRGAVPSADIDIDVSALDFRSSVDEVPGQAAGSAASGSARVIPDATLDLDALRMLDARARVRVDEVRVNGLRLDALTLAARLEGGDLAIDRAEAGGPDGRLAMRLELRRRDGTADIAAALEAMDVLLDPSRKGMPEISAADIDAAPRYNGKLSLTASGTTVYELVGTLDGAAGITSDGGRLRNRGLTAVYNPFLEQIFSTINPFREKDPYTQISCMGAFFSIKGGVVRADPGLVVQTEKINVMSRGEVDLRHETISLDFRSEARGTLQFGAAELVNPFVGIGGTFSQPKIVINPASTLLSGGAALATGGISLLATAAWNRTFRAADPCASLASEAAKTNPRIPELLDRVSLLEGGEGAGPANGDR